MPGRGRRVWEMSQLRFRVVYNVPQVSLRRDLWPSASPHIPSYAKGTVSLPDLGMASAEQGDKVNGYHRSPFSVIPGEASWVSFCRAVQLTSGLSMVLELVQEDADRCPPDRCPPDLPNVPMQMSMRDIATMALMTGMKCTQASFEFKSLSMQGTIGTITTSQHPVLGPLLHFSPRNLSDEEIQDLQVGDGAVKASWMARMWDEVVIAGRRYAAHERKQIERDEAMWGERSRERAIVKVTNSNRSPPPSVYGRRRRRSSLTQSRPRSTSGISMPASASQSAIFSSYCEEEEYSVPRARSDGEWSFHESTSQIQQEVSDGINSTGTEVDAQRKRAPPRSTLWSLLRYRRPETAISDRFIAEIESGERRTEMGPHIPSRSRYQKGDDSGVGPPAHSSATERLGPQLQPRWFIKEYIEEKWQKLGEREELRVQATGPLLLEWYDEEGEEVSELTDDKASIARAILEAWPRFTNATHGLAGQRRARFYAQRWREIVNERQLQRESRMTSRSRSTSRSTNRPRSRTRSRRGSMESLTSRKSVISEANSRHHTSAQRHGSTQRSLSSSTGVLSRSSSYQLNSSYYQLDLRDNDNNVDEPSIQSLRYRHHRRGSIPQLQIRLGNRDIEYGDSPVRSGIAERPRPAQQPRQDTGNIKSRASSGSGSKPSDNSHSIRGRSHVGFDRTVEIIPPSSASSSDHDDNNDFEDDLISQLPKDRSPPPPDITRERQSREGHKKEKPGSPPGASSDPIAIKPILRRKTDRFPEEYSPVREGVSKINDTRHEGIPPNARWTKISRQVVSPLALERGQERFEERDDFVIVLRVLTREEIQAYAQITAEIRAEGLGSLGLASIQGLLSGREAQNEEEYTRGRLRRRRGYTPESSQIDLNAEMQSGYSGRRAASPKQDALSPHGSPDQSPAGKSASVPRKESDIRIPKEHHEMEGSPKDRSSPRMDLEESSSESTEAKRQEWDIPRVRSRSQRSQPISRYWPYDIEEAELLDDTDADSFIEVIDGDSEEGQPPEPGAMNWFWVCQIDTMPGYLATPWTGPFSVSLCYGAVAVVLEALGKLTDFARPVYVASECHMLGLQWMSSGRSTFPPYSINADHHGTIISGVYTATKFPGFRAPLFPLELLRNYTFQVDRHLPSDAMTLRARLTELMALDAWLSYCGRQPEISGRDVAPVVVGDLLYTMPMLIQRTMTSFTFEFENLERTAVDGGLQIVQQIARNLLDTLGWKVEGLSPAEKLFTLVAMLRTAKMALCIAQGTDTSALREIMLNDVQFLSEQWYLFNDLELGVMVGDL